MSKSLLDHELNGSPQPILDASMAYNLEEKGYIERDLMGLRTTEKGRMALVEQAK